MFTNFTFPMRKIVTVTALTVAMLSGSGASYADRNPGAAAGHWGHGHWGRWLVGTWYLALDTESFGLPPGTPPLSGIAIFNQDGTFQFEDGGDFGQMGFTGKNLTQYGAWQRGARGEVVGVSLFLEGNALTAEVEKWVRGRFRFSRTDDRDVVNGIAEEIAELPCDLGQIFSAISCPDPIQNADDFVAVPPTNIPITLKRLRPGR